MVFVGCHVDDNGKTVRYKGEQWKAERNSFSDPFFVLLPFSRQFLGQKSLRSWLFNNDREVF